MKQSADNQLINHLFSGLFMVNIVSMVSVILCMLIDATVIGQFLGEAAVTATGLLSPVAMLCSTLCSFLGTGLPTICTQYMGMADIKRVNQAFSLVLYATAAIGIVISLILYFTAPEIAVVLTPGVKDPQIAAGISDYLRGLAVGRVFAAASLPLTGIMMLDNDRNRAVAATIVTLVADVVLDLANVLVFHGGMFGMALATSVSGICGFLVLMLHFRKKNRVIHFTAEELHVTDLKDSFSAGFVGSLSQIGTVVRGFFFNWLLLIIAGEGAVTALAVANNAFIVIVLLFVALLTTTSTLCSMFFGEEDTSALSRTMRVSFRYLFVMTLLVGVIFLVFPKPVASVFLNAKAASALAQAARFIRFMTLQYMLAALTYPFAGGLLGTKCSGLNNILAILRETVFPILSALALGTLFGLGGVEVSFIVTGLLVLLSTIAVPLFKNKKLPVRAEDFVILPDTYRGVLNDADTLESSIKNMEDVITVSAQVQKYCIEKGADSRTALFFALFVEEMAGNTVRHGFAGKKGESIDLRLIIREDQKIIRMRDNGKLFDPVTWLEQNHPEDKASRIGIRMIIGMARDVQYIPALKLNNLIVTI